MSKQRWTENDINYLNKLRKISKNREFLAEKLGRTPTAVSIKLKRLNKQNNTYNQCHAEEKRKINQEFIEFIKPKTILDLYSGQNDIYNNYQTTKNDINKYVNADYHEKAEKLIHKLYYENCKYDFIDLDPYGSPYDCIELAIKMANKGIAITLGELGHIRFKRIDYVQYRYNINNLEEFTIEKLINEIQKIAKRNKKELIVYKAKEWKLIGRVWFLIK